MCRFLAYLGTPVTLQSLLVDPPRSLLHQSFDPRHQDHGTVNADGFGVGWYDRERRAEPARHRTSRPMWADRSFASWAGLVSSGAVLAAVRSATPPAPVEDSGVAPFTAGPWLFVHNGAVDGFRSDAGARLRRLISDRRAGGIEGASDSEVLFALALDHLDGGASLAEALEAVAGTVLSVTTARLNLVLTDGRRVAATSLGHSLFTLSGTGLARDGTIVASEPHDDDPRWAPVADGSIVVAEPAGATVAALAT
jgi:glutamine amidotransferase